MLFPRRMVSGAVLALLACGAFAPRADAQGGEISFTTRTGLSFQDVSVTQVTPYKILIQTDSGALSIRTVDLPADLQARFAAEAHAPLPPKVGDRLDFTTRAGRKLSGVTLRRIEPVGLTIETAESLEKIPCSQLPDSLRAYFDYSPEEIARYDTSVRAALTAQAEKDKAAALAAERAAKVREAAAARTRKPTPKPAAVPVMGARGEERLGTPRLGGSGQDK